MKTQQRVEYKGTRFLNAKGFCAVEGTWEFLIMWKGGKEGIGENLCRTAEVRFHVFNIFVLLHGYLYSSSVSSWCNTLGSPSNRSLLCVVFEQIKNIILRTAKDNFRIFFFSVSKLASVFDQNKKSQTHREIWNGVFQKRFCMDCYHTHTFISDVVKCTLC